MATHYTGAILPVQRNRLPVYSHTMLPADADRDQIIATLAPLCQDIATDILQDFVTRMDPDYFTAFPPKILAAHIKQAAALTPDHPCEVTIVDAADGRCIITIVAYDYFSEFATICGLLSAFGLNIEEGQIYTFVEAPAPTAARASWTGGPRARPKGRPGLSRKKIVDVFRVQPVRGASFAPEERRRLTAELTHDDCAVGRGPVRRSAPSREPATRRISGTTPQLV